MTSIPPPVPGPIQDEPLAAPPEPFAEAVVRPTGRAVWKPWTAWVAFVSAFGFAILGGGFIVLDPAAGGASLEDPPTGVVLAGTFVQDFAMIGAALLFACIAGRPRAVDFGLRRPAIGLAVRLALGAWFAFFAFSWIWSLVLGLDDEQTLPDELGIDGSTANLALVIVLITVMAPLGEEMLFRGYFFGALRNWRGYMPAAVITGLLFGAIHIGSSPIGFTVPLAFFGFCLCLLYQRTGSLYPCIGLHALNNSVALGVLQHWSVGEIALLMAGALAASLMAARLLALGLGGDALPVAGTPPQPAA